jgi:hypothetical protein
LLKLVHTANIIGIIIYIAVKHAFFFIQDAVLRRLKIYVCGDAITDINGLVTLRAINCQSDVEIAYYSSSFSRIAPTVCCYCGTEDNLLDDNNIYIQELYTKFSKVRPSVKPAVEVVVMLKHGDKNS